MNAVFQQEFFYNCMPELAPLFLAEWEEIIKDYPTEQELSPAWDKYVQMEMMGTMVLFTARSEGKLIGYVISIIHPHLHFSQTLYAFIDAFYVTPDQRIDEIPEGLLSENTAFLAQQGVKRENISLPASAWQIRLMKKLNYDRVECTFAKWL